MRTRTTTTILGAAAAVALAAGPALAGSTVVRVDELTGDGVEIAADGETPFTTTAEFSLDAATLGHGSLHVLPIVNDNEVARGDGSVRPADAKFEAFVVDLVEGADARTTSLAVDYLMDGVADSKQIYVNVYVIGTETETFYDCRYDYVAPADTGIDEFATLAASGPATVVTDDDPADGFDCTADPAGLADGAVVSFAKINVGDTSASDEGVGAFLDSAAVTVDGHTTVLDFEVPLQVKDDCKNDGWMTFGFANQGECVSSLQANEKADK